INGNMQLNEMGNIAEDYLQNIPNKYTQTKMHAYVVMPNHVHSIIEIMETGASESVYVEAIHADSPIPEAQFPVGAIHESPLQEIGVHEMPPLHEKPPLSLRDQRRKMLLSKIMGWYKMNTAKNINIMREMTGVPFWQRGYHDHIIRDEP